ncbi:hypothetical protein AB0E55_23255 [Amycolatopsis keratiniphila]|uniref:hypothetical protein n=1 Tax=Amycolatopsis keratiniphila TaxID=129921 RepID=UPI003408AB2C
MRLPYAIDDEHAAVIAVGQEINHPDTARWRAMTTKDDRLRQTYRALGLLIKQVEVSFLKRKADLRAFEGTRKEYRQAASEYEDWKSRTVHFANRARERRAELEDRVRLLKQSHGFAEIRTALRTLAQAVADHRDTIRRSDCQETTADRMLWVRLDLLPEGTLTDHASSSTAP